MLRSAARSKAIMNEISPVIPVRAGAAASSRGSAAGELWQTLRHEAAQAAHDEALLAPFYETAILAHDDLGAALAQLLAGKLAQAELGKEPLAALVAAALDGDPAILAALVADLAAVRTRDPASESYVTPFLYFKGFHALQWHRIGHFMWRQDRRDLAHFLQSRVSEVFAIDIHPAVPVGQGVFIDHGTGVVIGETAVIGNDVSILHGVTLGGTGKERGDRHPKVEDGVLLSAGAKVLGNITLGRNAKIGAGSVVLHDVPPCATVAGVPARIVGWCREAVPALMMDQTLPDYDYVI
jgi:serine O-acetyltransferase